LQLFNKELDYFQNLHIREHTSEPAFSLV